MENQETKKRTGRPRNHDSSPKRERVQVMFSQEEVAALIAEGGKFGHENLSSIVRWFTLNEMNNRSIKKSAIKNRSL